MGPGGAISAFVGPVEHLGHVRGGDHGMWEDLLDGACAAFVEDEREDGRGVQDGHGGVLRVLIR
jgi:hypothetical protein